MACFGSRERHEKARKEMEERRRNVGNDQENLGFVLLPLSFE
jgi:hypothetical protein